jgi:hypothetical protein
MLPWTMETVESDNILASLRFWLTFVRLVLPTIIVIGCPSSNALGQSAVFGTEALARLV